MNAGGDKPKINIHLISPINIAYLLVCHSLPKNTHALLVMLLLDSCTRHIIVYERGPFLFPFDFHKVYMVMIPFPICEKRREAGAEQTLSSHYSQCSLSISLSCSLPSADM